MLIFHSESAATWETIADWGTWMVVVGVAAEGLEILVKILTVIQNKSARFKDWLLNTRCEKCLNWCHRNELVIELWGLVWWLVVVLGLVVEFQGNHEARKIGDQQSAELNFKAAEAYKQASQAVEAARILESNNLVLRSNVASLELRLRDRRVTTEQMSSFTLLSKFINKIPITILVPQQGRDTETFSFDLRRMFTLAGFKTNADSDMTGMNRPEAFMRRITSSNPEVPDVMIITHHDIKFLPPFTFHILPFGLQQPMFLEETNEDRIYQGIEYCLKQINITTTWITDTNLVRPGYCAILVPIK